VAAIASSFGTALDGSHSCSSSAEGLLFGCRAGKHPSPGLQQSCKAQDILPGICPPSFYPLHCSEEGQGCLVSTFVITKQ